MEANGAVFSLGWEQMLWESCRDGRNSLGIPAGQ